ncbi:hypothetical protein ILYODFUR_039230 [Ilyodon furcidens]|uniref:Uncharacterized protein n=1 Tax=Ilyodon furcidens TaxID=33524 RepID=A0ABV0UC43_9TELE
MSRLPARATEVSWKLTLCSQSSLQTSSLLGQRSSPQFMRLSVWAEKHRSDLGRNDLNVIHFMKFGFVCVELCFLGASRLSAAHVLRLCSLCVFKVKTNIIKA